MKKTCSIDNMIELIENRLTEDISVSSLAQQSFFSKTHYQRLFRAMVGEPVMVYVKNRRLQLACRDIVARDDGILDIALKYGYDTHEGFTRAFKAYFGATPSEYRRRIKQNENQNETEVTKMLSKDAIKSIGQNMEKLSAMLTTFAEYAERLTAQAHKTVQSVGSEGITASIVARELGNLAYRMKHLRDEHVKVLAVSGASTFEMFDKIISLIRNIDDVVFQMNLLRFFSGIETGRMYLQKDKFEEVDSGYAKLCNQIVGGKEHMLALVYEAIELIHADIKQEAASRLAACVKAVGNATEEGKKTESSMRDASSSQSKHGGAFGYIAEAVSATLIDLESISKSFNSNDSMQAALNKLENTAFSMNIHAFNSSIETARSGNAKEYSTEKIMSYAGILHQTYKQCTALCSEYEHLTELTKRSFTQSKQALDEKLVDDIIFQSKIMLDQFSLEAERASNDAFLSLAKKLANTHAQLVLTRDVSICRKSLEEFLCGLSKAISDTGIDGSFSYIAKEYGYFVERCTLIPQY